MRTPLHLFLASILLAALCASGPSPGQEAQPEAETYTDATGHTLSYGLNAQRIVSLAPNVTEMLHFLGLGGRLVGRSDFCDYPPEVLALPSVGGFVDTSLERIVALTPDLVVAYQGNSLELVEQLRQARITVVAFAEPAALNEIAEQMAALHRIAAEPGTPQPVELISWQGRLTQATLDTYPEAEFFSCFFGYPGETSLTCGGSSFVSDLLRRAGAVNVAAELEDAWPMVSAEFIVAAQPEWILTATDCTADENPAEKTAALLGELRADPVFSTLPAVREGKVIVLDADVLLRPGPRVLDALRQLNLAFTERMVLDLTLEFQQEEE